MGGACSRRSVNELYLRVNVQVSASSLYTGIFGGYCNVLINLKGINNEEYVSLVKSEIEELLSEAKEQSNNVQKLIIQRI